MAPQWLAALPIFGHKIKGLSMEHQPLESSNIASTAYDPQSQALQITFRTGATYEYSDVPPDVAAALRSAQSAGQYLAAAIRGHYSYRRMQRSNASIRIPRGWVRTNG